MDTNLDHSLRRWRRMSPRDREDAGMEPSVVESADESPEKLAPPKQAASPKPQPQKRFLTVCGIVRDELDLPEWVAYQFAIGADHVHLIDNEKIGRAHV